MNDQRPSGKDRSPTGAQAQAGAGKGLPGRIGRFEVRSLLGAGVAGTVYRAHDPRLARDVALKVAHPGTLQTPRDVERFLREARAAGNLRHPHIVPIYDAGHTHGLHYLAAAFIEGTTLAEALKRDSLELRQKVVAVHQLAEALAHAHRKGIVHRDVKPANVLLDSKSRAYLTDFGLARREQNAEERTQVGQLFGSLAYLAPERMEGQGGSLAASDQYSLGAVLFECLTGRPPFQGDAAALLYLTVHEQPPSPRKLARTLPRDLERICLKAIQRRPEDRYPSCQEFADDLRRWLDGEAVHARPLGPLEKGLRWAKREPGLALSCAVALLALLAVLLVPIVSAAWQAAAVARQEQARRQADEAAVNARQAAKDAEEAKQRADTAAREATEAATVLDGTAAEAERARTRLKETADKARQARLAAAGRHQLRPDLQYASDMIRASRHLNGEDESPLPELLTSLRPKGGQPDMRGFEWFLLDHHLRSSFPLCRFGGGASLAETQLRWTPMYLSITTSTETILVKPADLRPTQGAASIRNPHTHKAEGVWLNVIAPAPDGPFHFLKVSENTLELSGGVKLSGFDSAPTAAYFSTDGKRLVTFHPALLEAPSLHLWDLEKKRLLRRFTDDSLSRGLLKLSPYGDVLATTGDSVRLWRETSAKPVHELKAGAVKLLAFSPDGGTLATASGSDVRLWSVATGKEQARFKPRGPLQVMFFAGDGRWLLTASAETVQVWDVRKGVAVVTVEDRPRLPGGIALSADGSVLAVLPENADAVTLRRVPGGDQLGSTALDHKGALAITFSPAGKQVAILYQDNRLQLWKCSAVKPALLGHGDASMNSLALSGSKVIASDADGVLQMWGLKKGGVDRRRFLSQAPPRLSCVLGQPQGQAILDSVGLLRVLRAEATGLKELWKLPLATGRCLASGGSVLAAGLADGSVRVWETSSGKEVLGSPGNGKPVRCIAFAKGGRLAIARGAGIDLVDEKGRPLATLPAGKDVEVLAWSPDGQTLISGHENQKLVFWDVQRARARVGPFAAHVGAVRAVACSPDGKTVVSGGADGLVRFWQLASGRELLTLTPRLGAITAFAFNEGGTILAVGGAGRVRLWYAPR